MSMKPVHKRGKRNRDEMWRVMLELGTFTRKDISHLSAINVGTVGDYLIGLEKAGYVYVERKRIQKNVTHNTYTVIRREPETPRIRKDGSLVTQGLGNEQMWRAIRMLKMFTYEDLALHASTEEIQVKPGSARKYISHLYRAGYITLIEPSSPGGKLAVYSGNPARCKGHLPPKIQRGRQIFDPNLNKVVWTKEDDNG